MKSLSHLLCEHEFGGRVIIQVNLCCSIGQNISLLLMVASNDESCTVYEIPPLA